VDRTTRATYNGSSCRSLFGSMSDSACFGVLRTADLVACCGPGWLRRVYQGRSWVGFRYVDAARRASTLWTCPKAICVSLSMRRQRADYNGGHRSKPVSIDTNGYYVSSISCSSSKLCLAVDEAGALSLAIRLVVRPYRPVRVPHPCSVSCPRRPFVRR